MESNGEIGAPVPKTEAEAQKVRDQRTAHMIDRYAGTGKAPREIAQTIANRDRQEGESDREYRDRMTADLIRRFAPDSRSSGEHAREGRRMFPTSATERASQAAITATSSIQQATSRPHHSEAARASRIAAASIDEATSTQD